MTLKNLLLSTSLWAGAPILSAATLTWTDNAFTDVAQISNAGTQVVGYNFGSATDVTVNGATFSGYNTVGAFTGSNFQPGNGSIIGNFNTDYSGNNVSGFAAPDELSLLNTANYGRGGEGTNLSGLSNGTQYLVQLLLVDNRSGFTGRNMHITADGTAWNTGLLVDYTSNGIPPYARLIETTFTADGTEQAFRWGIQNVGDYEGVAMQLRAVPEPSSTALLGLSGLALILRRRK